MLVPLGLLALPIVASASHLRERSQAPSFIGPFDKINLTAPDGSISASLLSFGATLTNLWVPDRVGQKRDVVLGYDNTTVYADPPDKYWGPIVGRYANRIKNAAFQLDGKQYNISANEHGGLNSLHGGKVGWDLRPWTIEALNASSVTFSLLDPAGAMGFPATVEVRVTHNLLAGSKWRLEIDATADARTPLLISSHNYWNLDGYQDPDSSILNHTLHLPRALQYVKTDEILIPTGELPSVNGTAYDFTTSRPIGSRWNETWGYCGTGCQGYDNAFVQAASERVPEYLSPNADPALVFASPASGIRLSIHSDQPAIQLYTTSGFNGTIPRKESQGGPGETYGKWTAAVIELEGVIDAISHPEWGIDQVYGNGTEYRWVSLYSFDTF